MSRGILITFGTFFGGAAIYVITLKLLGLVGREPWMSIDFCASFAVVGLGMILLTRKMKAAIENLSVEEMEKRSLLMPEQYEATRAFEVEECEDEGRMFFIELKNGPVLFLCGQYLYDHADFPCTEFTVLRHKQHGWVVDVQCAGTVLNPECEAPSFGRKDNPPGDGDIISNRGYEDIKKEMMQRKR